MSMELDIRAEHGRWFGRKCKIKHPLSTFQKQNPDRIYTITRVTIGVNFNEDGNYSGVYVDSMFYADEEGKQAGHCGRPDLYLEFLD